MEDDLSLSFVNFYQSPVLLEASQQTVDHQLVALEVRKKCFGIIWVTNTSAPKTELPKNKDSETHLTMYTMTLRKAKGKINCDIQNGLQTVWTSVKAGTFSSVWYHTAAQRHSCLQYQELIASSDKGLGAHMAGRGQTARTGVTNWWYVHPLPSSSSAPCSGRRCPLLWSRLPAP